MRGKIYDACVVYKLSQDFLVPNLTIFLEFGTTISDPVQKQRMYISVFTEGPGILVLNSKILSNCKMWFIKYCKIFYNALNRNYILE